MINKKYILGVLLISLVSAHGGEDEFEHHGMMSGFYRGMDGWGIFGWLIQILIIVILVLFIIWLVKQISQEKNKKRRRRKK